ncbi:MAG: SLBB domain-containing protein [Desulfobacteraceae bacterium]|nr:SLBB domain-containing protein [Desulfobacteraceae bacterium]
MTEPLREKPLTGHFRPDGQPVALAAYREAGGYRALAKALGQEPQEITKTVIDSHLRGRGGAGFPTGTKWKFMPMGPEARRPKYLTCNADEMEPGTFKDRLLMEGSPHLLLEGMIIAGHALQADHAYIFLRWAYRRAAAILEKAIREAYDSGLLGKNILGSGTSLDLHLHISAGRYMCGEEKTMFTALEGRRPLPRTAPPHVTTSGLWGKPTVNNNVETLCNVPAVVGLGAERYRQLSHTGDGGTKIYGVSGKVNRPGGWELPMGTTMRELLEEHAGGMQKGLACRGAIPGGASTEIVLEKDFDARMDFNELQKVGSRLGTGTMIVIDDRTCPVGLLLNLMLFFARESCGWCTPCREGLPWIARLLQAIEEGRGEPGDLEILEEHVHLLGPGHTFCMLAPGAMEPLGSGLKHFREDFERHIREKKCPWGG